MKHWVLGVGGAIVALVLAVAGIGVMLPVGHSATATRIVPGEPESVWEVMNDVDAFPAWRTGVRDVTRLPDRAGLPVWTESGPTSTMTLEVTEMARPTRMVTRIADEDLPFGGTWTYALEAARDGGTQVTLREDGEIYNPIFRFVARFILGYDQTMLTYLDGLEARMRSR